MLLAVILLGTLALIYSSFAWSDGAGSSYGPCFLEEDAIIAEPVPAKIRGALKPEAPEGMIIPFGRSREVHPEIFYLTMEQGVIPQREIQTLKLKKRPLRRQEVYATIFPEEYEAVARITGPHEATVRVCIPADVVASVHPGTYAGGVVIADPRVQKTTISITASLQYRRYEPIFAVFALGVLLAGTTSVWAAGRRAKEMTPFDPGALDDFVRWAKINFIPIVAGGAAALSAFIVSYWRNPSWGAKAPEDWLTLFGAMFSAFTATVVTTSRAGGGATTSDEEVSEKDKSKDPGAA